MSEAPGVGRPAPDARQGPRTPAPAHAHAWARMEFELVDDHPVVRERCETCGHVRRYRAWERYWDPARTDIAR